ncbi:MAG: zinc ribbon domain-containing protein [Anaerolineales bacterium]|nr:zinc ribbon domain-containing protein [Anaerolineales bacterium]
MSGYVLNARELWQLLNQLEQPLLTDSPLYSLLARCNLKDLETAQFWTKESLEAKKLSPIPDKFREIIEILAVPQNLYTILTRLYGTVILAEFYERDNRIVEYSFDEDNTSFIKEPMDRDTFLTQIMDIIGEDKMPQAESPPALRHTFPLHEYLVLSAAIHLEQASQLIGEVEGLGFIHFTKSDLMEEMGGEGRFEVLEYIRGLDIPSVEDFLAHKSRVVGDAIGSLLNKGYLDKVESPKGEELLALGPQAMELFERVRRPSKILMTLSRYTFPEEEMIKLNTTSLLWSKHTIYNIAFSGDDINFIEINNKAQLQSLIQDTFFGEVEAAAETPPQYRLCTQCGARLKVGKRFCTQCGAPLG